MWLTQQLQHLTIRTSTRLRSERGDVPGWVLITMMTAGIVVGLWTIAGPALNSVFTDAINRVTGH